MIRELSEDLIKQIAAGEVIERPASVVKELVENSIDAGSTKIEIEIQRSGKYIKISDNGIGIHSEDVPLLFKRHATSKLKNFDELWDISTLGFRGEALASISSISKIVCRSKHIDEEVGYEIKVAAGKIDKKTSSISRGTAFEINDLFYNIPAREKFLKSESTEINHIYDSVIPEALAHPEISFKLVNSSNDLLETSGSGNLKQAIIELLGNDLKENLIEVSSKLNSFEISGFISSLEAFRNSRKNYFTFINSRPVKCHIISKAIQTAYSDLLPPGKSPVVILNLKFKPKMVDINVHPTKKEVRYTNSTEVYNSVLSLLQKTITDFYKDKYKENSKYQSAITPAKNNTEVLKELEFNHTPSEKYTQAAFDLYKPEEEINSKSSEVQKEENKIEKIQNLFLVQSLRFEVITSDKPKANITKIGNKSIFEVGNIFDNSVQVVASGEVVGDGNYQKIFFDNLSDLISDFYKKYLEMKNPIQSKILSIENEDDKSDFDKNEHSRKKPPQKTLEKIWERDNWTCVYCEKQLLDPKVVSKALKEAKEAFITYINNEGKEITSHTLLEHSATYDHYLPASKLPQFNLDEDNLFASCMECNRKKSDSVGLESWKPVRKDSWNKPLEIADLKFDSSKTFSKLNPVK